MSTNRRRSYMRYVGRIVVAATLVGVMSHGAQAQRCRNCTPEDTTHHLHLLPGVGLRAGAPQKVSAAAGLVLGDDWHSDGRDHSRNVALFVEPGMSAGRASLAYLHEGFGTFGSGVAIAATAMRTWKDPWWTQNNVTYAGGELIVWPVVFVGPRVGVFRSLTGPMPRKWVMTLDFGIGL